MGQWPEREYGLGTMERDNLDGPPRIAGPGPEGIACPNCGCGQTFLIQVDVKAMPIPSGQRGMMTYVGCACCPWASKALIVGMR